MDTTGEAHLNYIAYIGLGSNIGERDRHLAEARRLLLQQADTDLAGESPLYETEPVGYVDQAAFLNQVLAVRTALPPHELHRRMAAIELQLGRTRDIRWGPRTLDLDLLLVYPAAGGARLELEAPELTVPHPRMRERAFVLIPLLDVMTRLQPDEAVSYERHLDTLEGKAGVRPWKKTKSPNA